MRCFLLYTLLALLLGCSTSHRKARDDLPPEERAIVELSALLKDFRQAVSEPDFDEAEDVLEELEEGLKDADVRTIAHPDYAEVAAAIDAARPMLEKAKRDRIVAQLIERTQVALDRTNALLAELGAGPPREEQVEELDELIEELGEFQEEGKPYRDDATYAEFAVTLDASLEQLTTRSSQLHWLLGAVEAFADVLEDIAEPELPASAPLDDQIARADAAVEAYKACVAVASEQERKAGYAEQLIVATVVGNLTLADTRSACEGKMSASEALGLNLHWRRDVEQIARRVTTALKNIEAQESIEAQLRANQEAVEELAACEQGLAGTEVHPGYDPGQPFVSHMGRTSAVKLRDSCAKVQANLIGLQPTLRWRLAVEQLRERAGEAKEELAEAQQEEDLDDRIDPLSAALGGFRECAERAEHIRGLKDAAWHGAKPKRRELREVDRIARACRKDAARASKLLERARSPARSAPKRKKKRR